MPPVAERYRLTHDEEKQLWRIDEHNELEGWKLRLQAPYIISSHNSFDNTVSIRCKNALAFRDGHAMADWYEDFNGFGIYAGEEILYDKDVLGYRYLEGGTITYSHANLYEPEGTIYNIIPCDPNIEQEQEND